MCVCVCVSLPPEMELTVPTRLPAQVTDAWPRDAMNPRDRFNGAGGAVSFDAVLLRDR